MIEGPQPALELGEGVGAEEVGLARGRAPLALGGTEPLARIDDRIGQEVSPLERGAQGRAAVPMRLPPAVDDARHRERRRSAARRDRLRDAARRVPLDARLARRAPRPAEGLERA